MQRGKLPASRRQFTEICLPSLTKKAFPTLGRIFGGQREEDYMNLSMPHWKFNSRETLQGFLGRNLVAHLTAERYTLLLRIWVRMINLHPSELEILGSPPDSNQLNPEQNRSSIIKPPYVEVSTVQWSIHFFPFYSFTKGFL